MQLPNSKNEQNGMNQTLDAFFPDSPRVIYSHSPLANVICQLRFPPLLRIESEPPVEFQERIRQYFPLFERAPTSPIPQMAQLPAEIAQLIGARRPNVTYIFRTEDQQTTLTLSPESISLSTDDYKQWEQFRASLHRPLRALTEIYKPSFFSRIGLRYIDAIGRKSLGLQGRRWVDLLRPEILGELGLPQFDESLIQEAQRVIRLKSPGGGEMVSIRHGLAEQEGSDETYYMIDLDFYTDEKMEVERAETTLEGFNRRAGHAFRWCITETLHRALGPTEIQPVDH
jgi:uncharacterized protein (TIGR04255 family)